MGRVEAVTFDFWDTLVRHESDEPKRRARGLATKDTERRRLLGEALAATGPVDAADVSLAWDVADAGFDATWRDHAITWPLARRLGVIADGLGRELPADAIDRLVCAIGGMALDVPPDPLEDIDAALQALSRRYRLAVVSDAIIMPGRYLRRLLEALDLAHHFSAFAFSDEVGRSKPHPAIFEAAAAQLGVAADVVVHVGDREHNDVTGPHGVGARAVLFTGAHGEHPATTAADATCGAHRDLPAVVERLARGY